MTISLYNRSHNSFCEIIKLFRCFNKIKKYIKWVSLIVDCLVPCTNPWVWVYVRSPVAWCFRPQLNKSHWYCSCCKSWELPNRKCSSLFNRTVFSWNFQILYFHLSLLCSRGNCAWCLMECALMTRILHLIGRAALNRCLVGWTGFMRFGSVTCPMKCAEYMYLRKRTVTLI